MNRILDNEFGLFPALVVILIGHFTCLGLLLWLRDRLAEMGPKVDTRTSRFLDSIGFDPLGLFFVAFISPPLFPLYLPQIRVTWPKFRGLVFAWTVMATSVLAAWLLIWLHLR